MLNLGHGMALKQRMPILTFHALDSLDPPLSFPPTLFRMAMQRLHRLGYRAHRIADLAADLRAGRSWPERSFAVTFDDGYESVYREGFPVLRELGFPATVFVNVAENGRPLPSMYERPCLSWSQIHEMHEAGLEIGAHSVSHPDLTRLSPDLVESEATRSRQMIEDSIGAPVTSFAYPFGQYNTEVRAIVGRHFEAACTTGLGEATPYSDPLALPRLEMHYFRSERTLELLTSQLLPAYLGLRRIPRQVRRFASRIFE